MKTKIVYAVSSDEKDVYLEQTVLSVCSLRRYNPDAVVELVVDERTDKTIVGKRELINSYTNKKVVVKVPEVYDKKQTSRFLKTNLRQYIEGDYLFIDSDTVITDSLAEIDSFDGDIGAVINEHVPISQTSSWYKSFIREMAKREGWLCSDDMQFFNSGVLYVKDSNMARKFCSDWHEAWKESLRKYGVHYDQPPLALINERYGYLIKELSGEWNCQIMNCALPFLNEAKIIHYYSSSKGKSIYAFRDRSIYLSIRENGYITDDILKLIGKAKSAYVNPIYFCRQREYELLSGEMAQTCLKHQRVTKILNSFFRILNKINFWRFL